MKTEFLKGYEKGNYKVFVADNVFFLEEVYNSP